MLAENEQQTYKWLFRLGFFGYNFVGQSLPGRRMRMTGGLFLFRTKFDLFDLYKYNAIASEFFLNLHSSILLFLGGTKTDGQFEGPF